MSHVSSVALIGYFKENDTPPIALNALKSVWWYLSLCMRTPQEIPVQFSKLLSPLLCSHFWSSHCFCHWQMPEHSPVCVCCQCMRQKNTYTAIYFTLPAALNFFKAEERLQKRHNVQLVFTWPLQKKTSFGLRFRSFFFVLDTDKKLNAPILE